MAPASFGRFILSDFWSVVWAPRDRSISALSIQTFLGVIVWRRSIQRSCAHEFNGHIVIESTSLLIHSMNIQMKSMWKITRRNSSNCRWQLQTKVKIELEKKGNSIWSDSDEKSYCPMKSSKENEHEVNNPPFTKMQWEKAHCLRWNRVV